MNHSLSIEGYVTKKKEYIGQLKDDSVFLLNDVKSTLHDKKMEKYTEKQIKGTSSK